MIQDNPNRYAFGFGVYVISEIDKERSNSKKLNEKKANLTDCNQQNDLFDLNTMMCRQQSALTGIYQIGAGIIFYRV